MANFTGALVTLRSVTGTGNGNALETLLYSVDATNAAGTVIADSGDICINEVAAGTDLRVVSANNSAGACSNPSRRGIVKYSRLGGDNCNWQYPVESITGCEGRRCRDRH